MTSITQFFSIFAFSQLTIALMLLLPLVKSNNQVKLYSLLMICSMFYLLPSIFGSFVDVPLLWWLVFLANNLLPGVFYLTGLSIFSDHSRLKKWQLLFAISPFIILLISQIIQLSVVEITAISQPLNLILMLLKQSALVVDLALVIITLFVAIKFWRDDLVQERRIIRGAVISITGCYIILVIVLGQVFKVQWTWLANLEMILLAGLVCSLNYYLFAPKTSNVFEPPAAKDSPIIQTSISRELGLVNDAMTRDFLYRQEGLTISQLSKHIGIHEHKLRALINGQLSFRNFNDFLNSYRVKEVSEKLTNGEFNATPILTLALESGFRSLSSFNKVFKETYMSTPSEYRKNSR